MPTIYTASVIGGGMGGQLSLDALVQSDRFSPLAVADVRAEARLALAAKYPKLRIFASHSEMFRECPTDVVCISTYAPSHLPLTLEAVKLGLKGIVVEKPLGNTAAEGAMIVKAIKDQSLPAVVPHGLLVAPHGVEILERVRAGTIGNVRLVEIQCNQWDILNAGIHWLNFFVEVVDHEPIDYVLAVCDTSTRTYRDGLQVETMAVTYAQTKSGIRMVMNTGDHVPVPGSPSILSYKIIGSTSMIEFFGWVNQYRIANAANPTGIDVVPSLDGRSAHRRHLENLADQMDRAKPDYRVLDSAQSALELCDAAYLSHRHRCMVQFPLSSFVPVPPNDWAPGQPYSGIGGGRDGRKL